MRVRTETIEEPLHLAKFAGRPGYELSGRPRRWRLMPGAREDVKTRALTERLAELNRVLDNEFLHVDLSGRVTRPMDDPDDPGGRVSDDEVKKLVRDEPELKEALRITKKLKEIREKREPGLPGLDRPVGRAAPMKPPSKKSPCRQAR